MTERAFLIEGDEGQYPDADELYGHEGEDTAVVVRHDGPIRTQLLTTRLGSSRTLTLDSALGSMRVLLGDPRRSRAVLLSIDQDMYVGASQTEADQGYGAYWPKLTQLVLNHQDEVWVRPVTGTSKVSIINEQWSR